MCEGALCWTRLQAVFGACIEQVFSAAAALDMDLTGYH